MLTHAAIMSHSYWYVLAPGVLHVHDVAVHLKFWPLPTSILAIPEYAYICTCNYMHKNTFQNKKGWSTEAVLDLRNIVKASLFIAKTEVHVWSLTYLTQSYNIATCM